MRFTSLRDYVLIVLVLLISTVNYGCDKDSSSSTSSTSAGKLVFAATTTPSGAVSSTMAPAARVVRASPPIAGVDFDLGDLNTTDTYLFVLKNTGTSDVTNVVLVSDNPNVTVTPSRIGVLQPDGQGGVVPVIKVSIQSET
jgi:hypothetical protein